MQITSSTECYPRKHKRGYLVLLIWQASIAGFAPYFPAQSMSLLRGNVVILTKDRHPAFVRYNCSLKVQSIQVASGKWSPRNKFPAWS